VLQNLIYTAETFNNLDGYDTLSVTWDPETGGTAEMHRPDGTPDIVHQVKHGALQIRAHIENVGIVSGTIENRLWCVSWGDDAEVLAPPELRQQVRDIHARAANLYDTRQRS